MGLVAEEPGHCRFGADGRVRPGQDTGVAPITLSDEPSDVAFGDAVDPLGVCGHTTPRRATRGWQF